MEWEPLPIEQGGLVNVGHQFEWAYLLSAAAERGLPAEWLVPARRLLDYGLLFGLDSSTGGVIGSTTYDGKPLSVEKGWWEQCEAIRALLRHTTAHGRADAKDPLARLIRFVQDRFVDTTFGGIYSNIEEVPTDSIPDKGSPWKVDYHTVGMCVEALRLTSRIDLHAGSG
jgi:mannose/cellobiose epimerase-like protein (N-acyl-D-glucosamine 2-epimerase family)